MRRSLLNCWPTGPMPENGARRRNPPSGVGLAGNRDHPLGTQLTGRWTASTLDLSSSPSTDSTNLPGCRMVALLPRQGQGGKAVVQLPPGRFGTPLQIQRVAAAHGWSVGGWRMVISEAGHFLVLPRTSGRRADDVDQFFCATTLAGRPSRGMTSVLSPNVAAVAQGG